MQHLSDRIKMLSSILKERRCNLWKSSLNYRTTKEKKFTQDYMKASLRGILPYRSVEINQQYHVNYLATVTTLAIFTQAKRMKWHLAEKIKTNQNLKRTMNLQSLLFTASRRNGLLMRRQALGTEQALQ